MIGQIVEKKLLAKEVIQIKIDLPDFHFQPGQFVQVSIPNHFLRRPLSIHDYQDGKLSLIYKEVGQGTKDLSQCDQVDILGPFGHGFPEPKQPITLVGGGLGVPPLVAVAKAYPQWVKRVVLGFSQADQVICTNDFDSCEICTMDGSLGIKGTVMEARLEGEVYACGPVPMLEALQSFSGYLSYEAHMACGFGVCMGCAIPTKDGIQRVCKEGPVFACGQVSSWT